MSQNQKSKRDLMWEQRKQAREARSHEPSSKGSNFPTASEKPKNIRTKDKNENNTSLTPQPQTKASPLPASAFNKNHSQGPLPNEEKSVREESISRDNPGYKIPTEVSGGSPPRGRSLERSPVRSVERNGSKSRILENTPPKNQPLSGNDLDVMNEKEEERKKKHDYAEFLRHQMIEKYQQRVKMRNEDQDIPTKIGQREDDDRVAMFERKRKQQYADFLRLQMEEKAAKQKKALHESMEESRRDVSPPYLAKEKSYTPNKLMKQVKPVENRIDEYQEDDDSEEAELSMKNLVPQPPQYEKVIMNSRKEPEKPIVKSKNIFQPDPPMREATFRDPPVQEFQVREHPRTPEQVRRSFHKRKYQKPGKSLNQSLIHPDEENEMSYENLPTKERTSRKVEIFSPNRERDYSEEGGAHSGRSRKGEKMGTDGTRGFLLDSEHPMVVAAKEKVKKDYQREIKEQIEEKRRKKEAEIRKRIHDEQMEELRVQREQEELALKFMREKETEIVKSKVFLAIQPLDKLSSNEKDKQNLDEEDNEFSSPSRKNLNDPKPPEAPKIVFRQGRKMILTPEQEEFERMQKQLAEKEEAVRQMHIQAEKAKQALLNQATEAQKQSSERMLPTLQNKMQNSQLAQRQTPSETSQQHQQQAQQQQQQHIQPLRTPSQHSQSQYSQPQSGVIPIYNGTNYIAPQPIVMQYPNQAPNNDNDSLKKEIQELKAEVNKYNSQLAVQINEAKREVHHAVEERNRAEQELNRLKEELRMRSLQKHEQINTIEAMDPNFTKNQLINSLNSNDDNSVPHSGTIQSQDLHPHYIRGSDPIKRGDAHMKPNFRIPEERRDREHTEHSSKQYLHTGGSDASVPTNPNTGSNNNLPVISQHSKRVLHENPSSSDITVSLMHQTKLVPFGGIDHLTYDSSQPKPMLNLKEKSNQYESSQLIPEHYDDSPVALDVDRKRVPVQNQRGSLEYPNNASIAVTESLGMKLYNPTQSNEIEIPRLVQAKTQVQPKSETENKLKEIVNYKTAPKSYNVSPMAPASKIVNIPYSEPMSHHAETKSKTPKKIDTDFEIWPRTDQSANLTPRTDQDSHPVPSQIARELYPVAEDPNAELQTTMFHNYNTGARDTTNRTNNSFSNHTQPRREPNTSSNVNRSMEYHVKDSSRPQASRSDAADARSNSKSSTPQNPSSQPIQTHPKVHPNNTHTTRDLPPSGNTSNYPTHTQSTNSARTPIDGSARNAQHESSIRLGRQGAPSANQENSRASQKTHSSADERKPAPQIDLRKGGYQNHDVIKSPVLNGALTPQEPVTRKTPLSSTGIEQKFPVFEPKNRGHAETLPPKYTFPAYDSTGNTQISSGNNIRDLEPGMSSTVGGVTLLQNKTGKFGYEKLDGDRDKSPLRTTSTPKPTKNIETFSHAGLQILQADTQRENAIKEEASKIKQLQAKRDPYEDYPQIRASIQARVNDQPGQVRDIFATIQDGKPKRDNVFGHKYNPIPWTSSKDLLAFQRSQLGSADSNFNARDIQFKNEVRLDRLEKFGIFGLDDSKEDIFQVRRKFEAQNSQPPQRFLVRDSSKDPNSRSPMRNLNADEAEDEITRLDNLLRKHIRNSQAGKIV